MADEIPTADWPTLFRELPLAIRQLEARGTDCDEEAGMLLSCALDVLRRRDASRCYDTIVFTMGQLALMGEEYGDKLPRNTRDFLEHTVGGYFAWDNYGEEDADEGLVAMLAA